MNEEKEPIKQIHIWILFCIAVFVFGIFLYEEIFNFSPLTEFRTETAVIQNNPEAESENESENQEGEKTITDETQANIPETESPEEPAGPEGQLVHHLFNIESVPSPKAVAFSPDGKEIWAALLLNPKRGISVFDALTGEKKEDINLDGGGVEITFSRAGDKAYVSQMETAKVFEIDSESKGILRILDTRSAWTKGLYLSPDGKTIFASNWSGDDISEIDLEEGKALRRIPTVDTPRGIYVTGDNSALYVAGFGSGELEKIDLKTGVGKVIFKSGGAIRHIAADEEKEVLYVSDMAQAVIWQVSLKNDEVRKFADTDYNPNTIKLSPDKKILFVSCRGINASADNYYIPGPEWGSVLIFDTETGKMLDAIVAGNQPTGLDISPDGRLLVFSDFLDSKLEVFEVPPYEVLKQGNGGRSRIYKEELRK